MMLAGLEGLKKNFGRFASSYRNEIENPSIVVDAVIELAKCFGNLRDSGRIGAYIDGLAMLSRFRQEMPLEMVMEPDHDPAVMQAIADYLPVSEVKELSFFISCPESVMRSAVTSLSNHISLNSLHTFRHEASYAIQNLAKNGLMESADALLKLYESINSLDRMSLDNSTLASCVLRVFSGFALSNGKSLPGSYACQQASSFFSTNPIDSQSDKFDMDSARGLALSGLVVCGNNLAARRFQDQKNPNSDLLLSLHESGIDVEKVFSSLSERPTQWQLVTYLDYTLLSRVPNPDYSKLDLDRYDHRVAVTQVLVALADQTTFNESNTFKLMELYASHPMTDDMDLVRMPHLRSLGVKIPCLRASYLSTDLGI